MSDPPQESPERILFRAFTESLEEASANDAAVQCLIESIKPDYDRHAASLLWEEEEDADKADGKAIIAALDHLLVKLCCNPPKSSAPQNPFTISSILERFNELRDAQGEKITLRIPSLDTESGKRELAFNAFIHHVLNQEGTENAIYQKADTMIKDHVYGDYLFANKEKEQERENPDPLHERIARIAAWEDPERSIFVVKELEKKFFSSLPQTAQESMMESYCSFAYQNFGLEITPNEILPTPGRSR